MWQSKHRKRKTQQVRLPVDHACLTLHCVVQRQRVEVEKLLQLFELCCTVGFVCGPQHHRSVRSLPRGLLSENSPLTRALHLDPSALTPGTLLLRVGDLRACCFIQVHCSAFFVTLSSLSVAPFLRQCVPQACELSVIQVGPSPT